MAGRFADNVNKFKGRYGQIRLPAVHKWAFDRQGIHAILGLLIGSILPLTYATNPDFLLEAVGVVAILTYIFINYERSENVSINDYAYVDINGYFIGMVPPVAALIAQVTGFANWAVSLVT